VSLPADDRKGTPAHLPKEFDSIKSAAKREKTIENPVGDEEKIHFNPYKKKERPSQPDIQEEKKERGARIHLSYIRKQRGDSKLGREKTGREGEARNPLNAPTKLSTVHSLEKQRSKKQWKRTLKKREKKKGRRQEAPGYCGDGNGPPSERSKKWVRGKKKKRGHADH